MIVESQLTTKARNLEKALDFIEQEWRLHGKVKYFKEIAEKKDPRKNLFRLVVLILVIVFLGAVGVVGVDELHRSVIPRIMDFLRESQSGRQQQEAMKNGGRGSGSNKNDNNGIPTKPPPSSNPFSSASSSVMMLVIPSPPVGYKSWLTYFAKQSGIRERVSSLRSGGGGESAARCRCGDYVPFSISAFTSSDTEGETGTKDSVAEQEKVKLQNEYEGDDEDDEQQSESKKQQTSADQSPSSVPPQNGENVKKQQHLDDEELPPKEPSSSGRKFISHASKVFRKASGMINAENAGTASSRREGSSAFTASSSYIDRGILQPAFLLEANEAAYHAHLDWLSTRFDPPLKVVEIAYENLEDDESISDFLYWNTGWTSHHHQCCVIFSIPQAFASVTRIRNATRSSALPLLVERLTSLANEKSFEVQRNAACKAMVVMRVDPLPDEVKSKKTFKRMKKMFTSFTV